MVESGAFDLGHRKILQGAFLARRVNGDDVGLVQPSQDHLLAQESLPFVR